VMACLDAKLVAHWSVMPGTPSSLPRGRKLVRAEGVPGLAARDGTLEGKLS
jgi:hypothetical protein